MKTGRNDPCSCGSGEKYKKCCGKVIQLAVAAVPAPAPTSTSAASGVKRECGTCTACCDGWMVGTIRGHEMKPGTPCYFVHPEHGGCTIYDERPQSPCRNFTCAWMLPDSPLPDDFRPEQLGVIIVRIKWRGQPAYLLRSAGRDPDQALLGWMQRFSVQTGQPFFYEIAGEKLGFGPPLFQQDMLQRAQRGEPMW